MSKLSTCCGASKKGDVEICSSCYEWADFEEEDMEAIQDGDSESPDFEQMKTDALELLRNSSLRDDDGGLEDEILSGEPTEERWSEIFLQLRANLLRPIDLPNFNQTEWARSYKQNFNP